MSRLQSEQNHQQPQTTPSEQHTRREMASLPTTRAPKLTGAKFSNLIDKVQRKAPSLSPSRVLGRISNGGSRAASSPGPRSRDESPATRSRAPKAFSSSTSLGPDSSRRVQYSTYEPFANCEVIESWLVTTEERKRAGKMARKTRKFSLVKDADQLW